MGLGYLKLGQPATQFSGGEAQRIKLASELKRSTQRGALYVFDEPTVGLHPDDVENLMQRVDDLVTAGATVVIVEHDMLVAARGDWVIDIGPGAGIDGGSVVAAGTPSDVSRCTGSMTAPYLARALAPSRDTAVRAIRPK